MKTKHGSVAQIQLTNPVKLCKAIQPFYCFYYLALFFIHQDLSEGRDEGQTKFHRTLECGEKLYPTTSTDGREVIRGELRSLRDDWDTYSDGIAGVQRRLEATVGNWEAYEESRAALEKWLEQVGQKLGSEGSLKSTLPEKKGMLTMYRVSMLSENQVKQYSKYPTGYSDKNRVTLNM